MAQTQAGPPWQAPKHLHTWRASWNEVLKGQTWSVLGPSRMVDGVGRVAHMGAPEHAKEAAKAFGVGALSQGLVTYAMGVPALWMLGKPTWALALGAAVAVALLWTGMKPTWREALTWSASRYVVSPANTSLAWSRWGRSPPKTHGPIGFLALQACGA